MTSSRRTAGLHTFARNTLLHALAGALQSGNSRTLAGVLFPALCMGLAGLVLWSGRDFHAAAALALALGVLVLAMRHVLELRSRLEATETLQALQGKLAAERRLTEALLSTESRVATVLARAGSVPSAVFQARLTERKTLALSFISAQIEALLGAPAPFVLARARQALWKIPRAHRRRLLKAVSTAIRTGGGWDVTVPLGETACTRWLRLQAAPACSEAAERMWDGIVSDVTEQKTAEQQIVRLNLDLERRVRERTDELAAVNHELEAFSYSVSHDLRAPLRRLLSFADLLKAQERHLPQASAALLENMIAQTRQMQELIEALLELAQISRHDLRCVETDLGAIARAALEDLQALHPEREVQWSVAGAMQVHADPRLLKVMLENLLANAWKFSSRRERAQIHVGVIEGTPPTFFVRDNGAGFDPKYANRLFHPFQRLHPRSQFDGTGVGLATVQRIVRRHGGTIWAESRPEIGATFFFRLGGSDPGAPA